MTMSPLHRGWALAALALPLIGACRSDSRPAAPPEERMATLERTLESEHGAETLVADVDAWIDRARANALPAERERVEALAIDLRIRLERLKPSVGRQGGELTGKGTMAGDVAELKNAYDRAVASISTERKAAEDAMAQTLVDIDAKTKDFRVEISSFGIQGNTEVKRRLETLEGGRREAAETLGELRRAAVDEWPSLHRRWEVQVRRWNDDFQTAGERLKQIPPPEPTPKPSVNPRRKGKSE